MTDCSKILLFSLIIASAQAVADEEDSSSLIWTNINQNKYDYFGYGNSEIKPISHSVGLSQQLSPSWTAALSYSEFDTDTQWLVNRATTSRLYNQADIDSNSLSVSFNWQSDSYGLTLSLSNIDSNEFSVLHSLRESDIIKTSTVSEHNYRASSFSYDKSFIFEQWAFDWTIGIQHSKNEISSNILKENTTQTAPLEITQLDESIWSGYIDIGLSYWVESESFSWSPQLALSWNWEVSNNNDFTSLRESRRVNPLQSNSRLDNTVRSPDSGYLELAIYFDWHNNWSTTLAYSQSLSSDIDFDSLSFDIAVAF